MKIFYTYLWLRDDGTPYYAGKGFGKRAYNKGGHLVNSPKDKSNVLLQEHTSEEEAFKAEMFLIEYYGRKDLGTGILRNRTNGGEGTSGTVVKSETRQKLSERHKGKPWSEARRVIVGKPARKPTCHPDRKHQAHGLCHSCYEAKAKSEARASRRPVGYKRMPTFPTEETREKLREAARKRVQNVRP